MGKKLTEKATAPDFELLDTQDKTVRLADFHGKKNVVIVLTRGFV